MNNMIKYSRIKDLDEKEQTVLKTIVEKEFPKIQRLIKNISNLTVDVKTMKKDTRKRYIISLRVDAPGRIFTTKNKETERGGDWDLARAAHQELNGLYAEIKHHLKSDSVAWKNGGMKRFFQRFT